MQSSNRGDGSAAYDLRLFQANAARKRNLSVQKKNQNIVARERARAKVALVFRGALLVSMVIAVVVAMLCSSVELTELSTNISVAERKLAATITENTRLQAEVESKLSARNVEEYATQKLGMSTLDKSQVTYLKLNAGDEVELTESSPKTGLFEQVKMALGEVKAYIAD